MVDPLISRSSPPISEAFHDRTLQSCFDHIRVLGLSSFFVCGDATRNIEVMQDGVLTPSPWWNVDL